MIIEESDEFVHVVDLVHDLWFDVEGIVFDVDDSRVDIRLEKRISDFRKSDNCIFLVLSVVSCLGAPFFKFACFVPIKHFWELDN